MKQPTAPAGQRPGKTLWAAPDLGYVFSPSEKRLNELAQEKAKIVSHWLDNNSYVLLEPDRTGLINYLKKRMSEQGRFAGLKVKKGTNVFFLKFPLGGAAARSMAIREAAVYHYINTLRRDLPITKTSKIVTTPLGAGLVIDYFEGKPLERVKKSDKIGHLADLLYSIQTLPVRIVTSTPGVAEIDYLFGKGTFPIHTFKKYFKSVDSRIKLCLNGKPPRFSASLAKKIYNKIEMLRPYIEQYENAPVFAHRDFFDKNILVALPNKFNLALVDFEHAAIVKNYILGLNFDLANIIVQLYKYPQLNKKLISLVRAKHFSEADKTLFDISLEACLIIQILAKIDYTAQKMTPGGVEENVRLLSQILTNSF